jgi:Flp pilus assembly protein TadG
MPVTCATPLRRARNVAATLLRSEDIRGQEDGQSLVEFALIFPILIVLVMAIIEFALAFNAVLGVNRASEHGVLVASEAGSDSAADCLILKEVEDEILPPNQETQVDNVKIQWTNPSGGTAYASNVYDRSGSTTCYLSDGTSLTVPYSQTSGGYPPSERCNVINGSGCTSGHTTVDTIGVQVRYQYVWKTPLGSLLRALGGSGSWGTGLTFNKRNVMRIEPVL